MIFSYKAFTSLGHHYDVLLPGTSNTSLLGSDETRIRTATKILTEMAKYYRF